MFSLRIITVDHYLSSPLKGFDTTYSEFRGCEVKQVPVIRVFGVTPSGQKACLHVHGVFPYISIPYEEAIVADPSLSEISGAKKYMQQLALNIDNALNSASGKTAMHACHVHKISPFSAVPFYGYHQKERCFLRIFFYNPLVVKAVVDLLHAGAIMNKPIQPHEAHIPYILQFFVNYNLYGMNMINLKKVQFRRVHAQMCGSSFSSMHHQFDTSGKNPSASPFGAWNSEDLYLNEVDKMTTCELEADCCADEILNRLEITGGRNPGLRALWAEEEERIQDQEEILKLTPPSSQERVNVQISESEQRFLKQLQKILTSVQDVRTTEENQGEEDAGEKKLAGHERNDTYSGAHQHIGIQKDEISSETLSPSSSLTSQHPLGILDTQDYQLVNALSRTIANDEDADSVLSTQVAKNSQQQQEMEEDDEFMTMEMSQIFKVDGDQSSEEESGFSKCGEEAVCSGPGLGQHMASQCWQRDRRPPLSELGSESSSEDDFTIPQLDGMHGDSSNDTAASSETTSANHSLQKCNFSSYGSMEPRRSYEMSPSQTPPNMEMTQNSQPPFSPYVNPCEPVRSHPMSYSPCSTLSSSPSMCSGAPGWTTPSSFSLENEKRPETVPPTQYSLFHQQYPDTSSYSNQTLSPKIDYYQSINAQPHHPPPTPAPPISQQWNASYNTTRMDCQYSESSTIMSGGSSVTPHSTYTSSMHSGVLPAANSSQTSMHSGPQPMPSPGSTLLNSVDQYVSPSEPWPTPGVTSVDDYCSERPASQASSVDMGDGRTKTMCLNPLVQQYPNTSYDRPLPEQSWSRNGGYPSSTTAHNMPDSYPLTANFSQPISIANQQPSAYTSQSSHLYDSISLTPQEPANSVPNMVTSSKIYESTVAPANPYLNNQYPPSSYLPLSDSEDSVTLTPLEAVPAQRLQSMQSYCDTTQFSHDSTSTPTTLDSYHLQDMDNWSNSTTDPSYSSQSLLNLGLDPQVSAMASINRKMNPRTMVIQNMKRMKLSLTYKRKQVGSDSGTQGTRKGQKRGGGNTTTPRAKGGVSKRKPSTSKKTQVVVRNLYQSKIAPFHVILPHYITDAEMQKLGKEKLLLKRISKVLLMEYDVELPLAQPSHVPDLSTPTPPQLCSKTDTLNPSETTSLAIAKVCGTTDRMKINVDPPKNKNDPVSHYDIDKTATVESVPTSESTESAITKTDKETAKSALGSYDVGSFSMLRSRLEGPVVATGLKQSVNCGGKCTESHPGKKNTSSAFEESHEKPLNNWPSSLPTYQAKRQPPKSAKGNRLSKCKAVTPSPSSSPVDQLHAHKITQKRQVVKNPSRVAYVQEGCGNARNIESNSFSFSVAGNLGGNSNIHKPVSADTKPVVPVTGASDKTSSKKLPTLTKKTKNTKVPGKPGTSTQSSSTNKELLKILNNPSNEVNSYGSAVKRRELKGIEKVDENLEDYRDVMWNLSYLSPPEKKLGTRSPPVCTSPTDVNLTLNSTCQYKEKTKPSSWEVHWDNGTKNKFLNTLKTPQNQSPGIVKISTVKMDFKKDCSVQDEKGGETTSGHLATPPEEPSLSKVTSNKPAHPLNDCDSLVHNKKPTDSSCDVAASETTKPTSSASTSDSSTIPPWNMDKKSERDSNESCRRRTRNSSFMNYRTLASEGFTSSSLLMRRTSSSSSNTRQLRSASTSKQSGEEFKRQTRSRSMAEDRVINASNMMMLVGDAGLSDDATDVSEHVESSSSDSSDYMGEKSKKKRLKKKSIAGKKKSVVKKVTISDVDSAMKHQESLDSDAVQGLPFTGSKSIKKCIQSEARKTVSSTKSANKSTPFHSTRSCKRGVRYISEEAGIEDKLSDVPPVETPSVKQTSVDLSDSRSSPKQPLKTKRWFTRSSARRTQSEESDAPFEEVSLPCTSSEQLQVSTPQFSPPTKNLVNKDTETLRKTTFSDSFKMFLGLPVEYEPLKKIPPSSNTINLKGPPVNIDSARASTSILINKKVSATPPDALKRQSSKRALNKEVLPSVPESKSKSLVERYTIKESTSLLKIRLSPCKNNSVEDQTVSQSVAMSSVLKDGGKKSACSPKTDGNETVVSKRLIHPDKRMDEKCASLISESCNTKAADSTVDCNRTSKIPPSMHRIKDRDNDATLLKGSNGNVKMTQELSKVRDSVKKPTKLSVGSDHKGGRKSDTSNLLPPVLHKYDESDQDEQSNESTTGTGENLPKAQLCDPRKKPSLAKPSKHKNSFTLTPPVLSSDERELIVAKIVNDISANQSFGQESSRSTDVTQEMSNFCSKQQLNNKAVIKDRENQVGMPTLCQKICSNFKQVVTLGKFKENLLSLDSEQNSNAIPKKLGEKPLEPVSKGKSVTRNEVPLAKVSCIKHEKNRLKIDKTSKGGNKICEIYLSDNSEDACCVIELSEDSDEEASETGNSDLTSVSGKGDGAKTNESSTSKFPVSLTSPDKDCQMSVDPSAVTPKAADCLQKASENCETNVKCVVSLPGLKLADKVLDRIDCCSDFRGPSVCDALTHKHQLSHKVDKDIRPNELTEMDKVHDNVVPSSLPAREGVANSELGENQQNLEDMSDDSICGSQISQHIDLSVSGNTIESVKLDPGSVRTDPDSMASDVRKREASIVSMTGDLSSGNAVVHNTLVCDLTVGRGWKANVLTEHQCNSVRPIISADVDSDLDSSKRVTLQLSVVPDLVVPDIEVAEMSSDGTYPSASPHFSVKRVNCEPVCCMESTVLHCPSQNKPCPSNPTDDSDNTIFLQEIPVSLPVNDSGNDDNGTVSIQADGSVSMSLLSQEWSGISACSLSDEVRMCLDSVLTRMVENEAPPLLDDHQCSLSSADEKIEAEKLEDSVDVENTIPKTLSSSFKVPELSSPTSVSEKSNKAEDSPEECSEVYAPTLSQESADEDQKMSPASAKSEVIAPSSSESFSSDPPQDSSISTGSERVSEARQNPKLLECHVPQTNMLETNVDDVHSGEERMLSSTCKGKFSTSEDITNRKRQQEPEVFMESEKPEPLHVGLKEELEIVSESRCMVNITNGKDVISSVHDYPSNMSQAADEGPVPPTCRSSVVNNSDSGEHQEFENISKSADLEKHCAKIQEKSDDIIMFQKCVTDIESEDKITATKDDRISLLVCRPSKAADQRPELSDSCAITDAESLSVQASVKAFSSLFLEHSLPEEQSGSICIGSKDASLPPVEGTGEVYIDKDDLIPPTQEHDRGLSECDIMANQQGKVHNILQIENVDLCQSLKGEKLKIVLSRSAEILSDVMEENFVSGALSATQKDERTPLLLDESEILSTCQNQPSCAQDGNVVMEEHTEPDGFPLYLNKDIESLKKQPLLKNDNGDLVVSTCGNQSSWIQHLDANIICKQAGAIVSVSERAGSPKSDDDVDTIPPTCEGRSTQSQNTFESDKRLNEEGESLKPKDLKEDDNIAISLPLVSESHFVAENDGFDCDEDVGFMSSIIRGECSQHKAAYNISDSISLDEFVAAQVSQPSGDNFQKHSLLNTGAAENILMPGSEKIPPLLDIAKMDLNVPSIDENFEIHQPNEVGISATNFVKTQVAVSDLHQSEKEDLKLSSQETKFFGDEKLLAVGVKEFQTSQYIQNDDVSAYNEPPIESRDMNDVTVLHDTLTESDIINIGACNSSLDFSMSESLVITDSQQITDNVEMIQQHKMSNSDAELQANKGTAQLPDSSQDLVVGSDSSKHPVKHDTKSATKVNSSECEVLISKIKKSHMQELVGADIIPEDANDIISRVNDITSLKKSENVIETVTSEGSVTDLDVQKLLTVDSKVVESDFEKLWINNEIPEVDSSTLPTLIKSSVESKVLETGYKSSNECWQVESQIPPFLSKQNLCVEDQNVPVLKNNINKTTLLPQEKSTSVLEQLLKDGVACKQEESVHSWNSGQDLIISSQQRCSEDLKMLQAPQCDHPGDPISPCSFNKLKTTHEVFQADKDKLHLLPHILSCNDGKAEISMDNIGNSATLEFTTMKSQQNMVVADKNLANVIQKNTSESLVDEEVSKPLSQEMNKISVTGISHQKELVENSIAQNCDVSDVQSLLVSERNFPSPLLLSFLSDENVESTCRELLGDMLSYVDKRKESNVIVFSEAKQIDSSCRQKLDDILSHIDKTQRSDSGHMVFHEDKQTAREFLEKTSAKDAEVCCRNLVTSDKPKRSDLEGCGDESNAIAVSIERHDPDFPNKLESASTSRTIALERDDDLEGTSESEFPIEMPNDLHNTTKSMSDEKSEVCRTSVNEDSKFDTTFVCSALQDHISVCQQMVPYVNPRFNNPTKGAPYPKQLKETNLNSGVNPSVNEGRWEPSTEKTHPILELGCESNTLCSVETAQKCPDRITNALSDVCGTILEDIVTMVVNMEGNSQITQSCSQMSDVCQLDGKISSLPTDGSQHNTESRNDHLIVSDDKLEDEEVQSTLDATNFESQIHSFYEYSSLPTDGSQHNTESRNVHLIVSDDKLEDEEVQSTLDATNFESQMHSFYEYSSLPGTPSCSGIGSQKKCMVSRDGACLKFAPDPPQWKEVEETLEKCFEQGDSFMGRKALNEACNLWVDSPSSYEPSTFRSKLVRRGLEDWQRTLKDEWSELCDINSTFSLANEVTEKEFRTILAGNQKVILTPCIMPPSYTEVKEWLTARLPSVDPLLGSANSAPVSVKLKDENCSVSDVQEWDESPPLLESPSQGIGRALATISPSADACSSESLRGGETLTNDSVQLPCSSLYHSTPVLLKAARTGSSSGNQRKRFCSLSDDEGITYTQIPKSRKSGCLSDSEEFSLQLHSPKIPADLLSPISPQSCKEQHTTSLKRRRLSFDGSLNHQASGEEKHGSLQTKSPSQKVLSLRHRLLRSRLQNQILPKKISRNTSVQIDGPTLKNSHDFQYTLGGQQEPRTLHEFQHLSVMSMEVHCQVRGNLKPDPEHDPVVAVFYCIHNDVPKDSRLPREVTGMIIISADEHAVSGELNAHKEQKESLNLMEGRNILCDHHVLGQQGQDVLHADQGSKECQTCVCLVRDCRENEVGSKSTNGSKPSGATKSCWFLSKQQFLASHGLSDIDTIVVDMEQTLFKKLAEVVMRWNPDIVIGYEIELLSWGYIIQRAEHLKVPLHNQLSRIHFENCADKMHSTNESAASRNVDGEIMLPGRVVLNAWRIFRAEIALNVYTFENVYYHVLHQRVPLYTFATLSEWLSKKAKNRWRVIDHYVTRVRGTLQLLERLNVIGRTSELARVFGIQFYEVLSRGSQFRVESMLMRSIKPLNYVAVSPSVQQRAMSRAPEWIPLILEPESRLYTHPVIVLDFQSLYPSIVIAYNYCYSTCLGRMEHLGRNDVFGFGCTNLHVPPPVLKMLEKDITISPCGVAFVKSNVRRGILPQMLEEILTTRIMVKSSMKRYKNDKALNRLLDARQLGLKLIANVTYGYTAANFSGRMPCVEVADSIVSKGRETLENAIRFVENSKKWKAHVVYGDTDSMFVLLPGQTKEEAFRIGQEIAEEVTAMNPKPVKLKFEKVYLPCLLQTKKRYVGFKFESPDQIEPVYDAKGIETVRRDSCPAVSKIVEKSLRILFSGSSVQVAKEYVQKQFQKFLTGKVSIQDCIFAKEYRGMGGYKPGACVPSLEISRRMLASDPLSEPRIGERVPYVIVYGPPGLPLIRLVHQPQDLLADSGLRINGHYYIRNVIVPPLNRIFSLIGVNVMNWYSEVPRTKVALGTAEPSLLKRSTISQYFSSRCCPVCGDSAFQGVCNLCQQDPQKTAVLLNELVRKWERMSVHIKQICQSCTGIHDGQDLCVSLVCPIRYCHSQVAVDISRTHQFRQIQARLLEF